MKAVWRRKRPDVHVLHGAPYLGFCRANKCSYHLSNPQWYFSFLYFEARKDWCWCWTIRRNWYNVAWLWMNKGLQQGAKRKCLKDLKIRVTKGTQKHQHFTGPPSLKLFRNEKAFHLKIFSSSSSLSLSPLLYPPPQPPSFVLFETLPWFKSHSQPFPAPGTRSHSLQLFCNVARTSFSIVSFQLCPQKHHQ